MIARHRAQFVTQMGDGDADADAAAASADAEVCPASLDERFGFLDLPTSVPTLALLRQLLELSPSRRIKPREALNCTFFAGADEAEAGAGAGDEAEAGAVESESEATSALESGLKAVEAEITAMAQMQGGTVARRRLRQLLWAELHDDTR